MAQIDIRLQVPDDQIDKLNIAAEGTNDEILFQWVLEMVDHQFLWTKQMRLTELLNDGFGFIGPWESGYRESGEKINAR